MSITFISLRWHYCSQPIVVFEIGEGIVLSNIIINGLQKAAQKEYKHLPDEIIEEAIHECT